jgi:hypothetical protein
MRDNRRLASVLTWVWVVLSIVVGLLVLAVLCGSPVSAADVLRVSHDRVRLETDREITALWVSVPGPVGMERGAGVPVEWSFQVQTVAGFTYASAIAPCTVEFVTGSVEVVRLDDCGRSVVSAPEWTGLLTTGNVTVATACAGCCCEPTLQIANGDCVSGVEVPEPSTWSNVKTFFRRMRE